MRGIPPAQLTGPAQDPGVPVEMFESANLDRALRKAQNFLGSEEFELAIKVLQDIIEGRVTEYVDPEAEKKKQAAKAEGDAAAGKPPVKPAAPAFELPIDDDNPAYSVFSSDEKIYRPVSRLCHELLAAMPPEGIGLYRVKFESIAEGQYRAAVARGDLAGLDAVYNHYFATLSAARAMEAAADLLMDAGRFRAAIQTLNSLLEVYPDVGRKEAGIHDILLMVKLAICYQQLGEFDLAAEQLAITTRAFPEDSVRLMGELHTVKDLHRSPLFDANSVAVPAEVRSTFTLDLPKVDRLVPLWEYRFTEPQPYRAAKRSNQNRSYVRFNQAGQVVSGSRYPRLNKYVPGTSVRFLEQSLVFLDGYRPVIHELTSGRQGLAMGDPALASYRVPTVSSLPRSRNPTYDYFQNRVAMDADRFYSVVGYTKIVSGQMSFRAIHDNRLAAYDRQTGAEIWSVDSKAGRKRPITFLAAPTVYRSMVLVPFMDAGSYGLMGLNSADGREVYRTYLHYRGTAFARAPAAPVVVDSGIAYVLTNAGVLAAVDANTGVLSWSRKYERVHPQRGPVARKRTRSRNGIIGRGYVRPEPFSFRGFAPSDLLVIDDLLILAAVDSSVLLCLNSANGKVMWLHNAEKPREHEVLDDRLWNVVGHNKEHLFVTVGEAGSQLLCIGVKSGLRYWAAKVPGTEYGDDTGRGFVTDDFVVLPGKAGSRRLHVIDARAKKLPRFRTVELPAFSVGKEPLTGPVNLFIDGAYLALSYEGGVELFSTPAALATLARQSATPTERATYLIHAGALESAAAILFAELDRTDLDDATRDRLSVRVLSLAEDVSLAHAKAKRRDQALAILDQCAKRVRGLRHSRRVHLFRLQVFRALGDVAGVEREQEFIESGGNK